MESNSESVPNGTHSSYAFDPNDKMQFCIFKVFKSPKLKSHKAYLNNYIVQKNEDDVKIKPKLFGTDLEEYKKHMVDRHWKFMLSPDAADDIHLESFAKEFVRHVEVRTGHSFYWQAAIHKNTAHPHIHILINGVDRSGRGIGFSPLFIKEGGRYLARQLCTRLAGERTQADIERSKNTFLVAPRFTRLDEEILNCQTPSEDSLKEQGFTHYIPATNKDVKKRCEFLQSLGIAKFNNGCFLLQKNWHLTLQAVGRYNKFLEARDELKWTKPYDLELYTQETGKIEGRIIKVYRMYDDEKDNWSNACIVENEQTKKAYFVPMMKPLRESYLDKDCTLEVYPANVVGKKAGKFDPVIIIKNSDDDSKTKKSSSKNLKKSNENKTKKTLRGGRSQTDR